MTDLLAGAGMGALTAIIVTFLGYALTRSGSRSDQTERRNIDLAQLQITVAQLAHDMEAVQAAVKDLTYTVAGTNALLSAFVKVEPKRPGE